MMIAPAPKLWPSALERFFGRRHLHVRVLEAEGDERVVAVVLDDDVLPLPEMPPGGDDVSPSTIVIGCLRMLLSVTSVTVMLRISGNVQPVSSYGDGLAGEKFWSEKYMSAIVRYGWSPRMM